MRGFALSPASHCLAALPATMSAFNSCAATGFFTKIFTRSETNSLDLKIFAEVSVLLEMI